MRAGDRAFLLATMIVSSVVFAGCTGGSATNNAAEANTGGLSGAGSDSNSPTFSASTSDPAPTAANSGGTTSNGATANGTNGASVSSDDPEQSRVYHLKDLKTVSISIAGKPYKLWLMDTPGKRQEGMMFLTEKQVKDDEGMLFVFPDVQKNDGSRGFWMQNCPMGLDIIYLSPKSNGASAVNKIGDGIPYNETSVPPGGDYQYVIELKRGTSKRIGLKAGAKIAIPASVKTSE